MNLKPFAALLIVASGSAATGYAAAQPARVDARLAAVAHRQGQMKRLRDSTKAIHGFVQGAHSNPALVRGAAATLQDVGARMDRLWPAGTGVGVGKSQSKREIWTERAAFQRRIAGFRAAAAGMARAGETSDKAQIGAQFRTVGAACKSCHDFFQVPR